MVQHAARLFRLSAPDRPFGTALLLLLFFYFLAAFAPINLSASQSLAAEAEAIINEAANAAAPAEANAEPAQATAGQEEAAGAKEANDAPPAIKDEAKSAPKAPPSIRLFGTVEFRSPIKNLPKWERVLKSEKQKPSFINNTLDAANSKVAEKWQKLRDKLKDEPLKEQAQRVNNFFNQWPYKVDLDVWGLEDYWATPREFINKSGDCEDYAISKYYALRDLGVPANQLRVAAIKDTIRNLGHAVLIVYMENDAYVLDNLTNLVLSHKKLKHYAPQYSVNEEFLWRHVKPKPAQKK